jgi:hypothetical protein
MYDDVCNMRGIADDDGDDDHNDEHCTAMFLV